jgi:EmrB/QacA subfamily drug resistance transporter
VTSTKLLDSQARRSSNILLLVVCLAQFMVILDVSIVNVALPSIRTGLHFSTTGLQWVVNAYTLTFAGFLMLGGRSADLLGRRRMFVAGTAMFALTSLICAVSTSQGMLLGARAIQGLSGAVISPATLSIISSTFTEGAARNRGLGAWAAMGGLGASSGALLGGILTQTLGWPAIFAVNVPLGAIVVLLALRVIPADAAKLAVARAGGGHFDLSGAVLVTAGISVLTFGIVRSDTAGWGSTGVIGPIAAGLALIAMFAFVEGRVARSPLVPLSIFRLRELSAANLVVLLLYAAVFSMWFFLTLFLQQVLHDDALQAGLAFLPMTLAVFTASTFAPRLIARLGARTVLTAGMLLAGGGLLLLTGVRPGGAYLAQVFPGGVLASLGMGLSLVSGTVVAMQGVPGNETGLASGLLNTSRLMGGALGLAVLSTLAASHTRGQVGVAAPQALTNGFTFAFSIGMLFCLAGAAAALLLLRRPARATTQLASETEQGETLGQADSTTEVLAA